MQIQIYATKIQITCPKHTQHMPSKNTDYILQMHNLYVVHTDCLCCKYTRCLCLRQKFPCITYTEYVFLCVTYTESVLSKLGATKCAPAGAFLPPKQQVLNYMNKASLFLVLIYIKHTFLSWIWSPSLWLWLRPWLQALAGGIWPL